MLQMGHMLKHMFQDNKRRATVGKTSIISSHILPSYMIGCSLRLTVGRIYLIAGNVLLPYLTI